MARTARLFQSKHLQNQVRYEIAAETLSDRSTKFLLSMPSVWESVEKCLLHVLDNKIYVTVFIYQLDFEKCQQTDYTNQRLLIQKINCHYNS